MTITIHVGDALEILRTLPSDSVHCCVTSPPYFGLRDYGVAGQMGLEATPEEFIAALVTVFNEVRRVLRPDGTCWVNMGDSYARNPAKGGSGTTGKNAAYSDTYTEANKTRQYNPAANGIQEKELIGIPWMLAFAMRASGWMLRQEIIWSKTNPMPESMRDRCTKSHEHIFLMTKSQRYYFDADAISEPVTDTTVSRLSQNVSAQVGSDRVQGKTNGNMKAVARGVGWGHGTDAAVRKRGRIKKSGANAFGGQNRKSSGPTTSANRAGRNLDEIGNGLTRNKRTIWTMATHSFKDAHFATFPPALPESCIKAGSPMGGVVLDPFFGAGTTGMVADRLRRECIGIELSRPYAEMARKRIESESPLVAHVVVT